ncbi:MAG: FHA domain-containing protein [Hyphomicrobiaceae bacterium]
MADEAPKPKTPSDPLRDGLKAIAGTDPERTALLNRKDAAQKVPLQSAIKAVEAALSAQPEKNDAQAATDDVAPTQAVKGGQARPQVPAESKTQMVKGKSRPERSDFHQEPVVGWLVVIGGPGLGAFRPIFEGNNTIGRAPSQRVPIDFGDDAISAEEQAYLRYDSSDRTFLFVPNLAKTNVVRLNDDKPTAAVKLRPMDVITMGRTQLVFVPFCGEEFDWSELAELSE